MPSAVVIGSAMPERGKAAAEPLDACWIACDNSIAVRGSLQDRKSPSRRMALRWSRYFSAKLLAWTMRALESVSTMPTVRRSNAADEHIALQRADVEQVGDADRAPHMRGDVAQPLQHRLIDRILRRHREAAEAVDAFCQHRQRRVVIAAWRDDLVVEAALQIALAAQRLLAGKRLVDLDEPSHRDQRVDGEAFHHLSLEVRLDAPLRDQPRLALQRILQRNRRRRAAEEFHHLLQRVRPLLRLDGAVVNLADQFEQFSIRSHELCFLK